MRKKLALLLGFLFLTPVLCLLCSCKKDTPVSAYRIEAEYFPETETLSAKMSVDFCNTSQNVLNELKFQLYPNAFRSGAKNKPVSELFKTTCYYAGESYATFSVDALTGGEWTVGGDDENTLTVSLLKPLYPDERAVVDTEFTLKLPKANHRLGVGKHAINLTHFYPVLYALGGEGFLEYPVSSTGDPFVSDCADYTVTLTLPKEYTAVCAGSVNRREEGDKAVYAVNAKGVRDIAFILGKDYKCVTGTAGKTQVEYYYQLDSEPEYALGAATQALSYFGQIFCDYGDERFVVCESDFVFGGMEYSGMALISNTLHKSERVAAVAHETAHQWWYYKVGSNQVEEAWQDEGLAEYSTALFMEKYPTYESSYRDCISDSEKAYRAYFSVYSQLGSANTQMTRPLSSYSGDYEYRAIAYDKGVVALDRVREAVGDKKFFAALEKYAKSYSGAIASRADFIACFERVGANAEGLFASFLDGKCVI